MSDSLHDIILVEAACFIISPMVAFGVPSTDTVATTACVVGVDGLGLDSKIQCVFLLKLYSVVSVCGSHCGTLCMGVVSKLGRLLEFCISKNCITKSHL